MGKTRLCFRNLMQLISTRFSGKLFASFGFEKLDTSVCFKDDHFQEELSEPDGAVSTGRERKKPNRDCFG